MVLLSGTNTYTGRTTIGGPIVQISNNSSFGSGTLALVSGRLVTGGGTALGQPVAAAGNTLTNPVSIGGTFTFDGSRPAHLERAGEPIGVQHVGTGHHVADIQQHDDHLRREIGELGVAHALSFGATSLGTIILSGASTYSGGTTLNTVGTSGVNGTTGTLGIAGSSTGTGPLASGPLGTGALILVNGILQVDGDLTIGNIVTIGANVANAPLIIDGGHLTFTSPVSLTAASTLSVNNTTTFAGVISGPSTATLTQQGTGTLEFTNANTYAGATVILSGTLSMTNQGTALFSSGFTVNQGGTLTLDNSVINIAETERHGGTDQQLRRTGP